MHRQPGSAELQARLDSLPRVRLAHLPTPLEEVPTLSSHVRHRMLIKRDDLTGLALGGIGFGHVMEYREAVLYELHEEHGLINLTGSRRRPRIGEVLTIVPNHVCLTVNLHEAVTVHRNGRERGMARSGAQQG